LIYGNPQPPLIDEGAPEAPAGLPEPDRRRVMIGSILGGGMFFGLLIALIVLVSGETPIPHPPPRPIPKERTSLITLSYG